LCAGWNPKTQGQRQEDCEFEACLGYEVRHCQKKQNKTKANVLFWLRFLETILLVPIIIRPIVITTL
jgi:hypothetical protein